MAKKKSNKAFDRSIKKNVEKGALHKQLGIKAGKKIPVSTLEKLKTSKDPQTRKRANFALNVRSWRKK
jgi:hypothetical protein